MDCPICKSDNDPKNKFCIVCGIKISDVEFIQNIDFVEQKLKTSHNGSKSIQITNSPGAAASLDRDAFGKDESFNFKSSRGSKDYIDKSIVRKTNSDKDELSQQENARDNKNSEIQYIKPDESRTIEKDSIIKDGLLSGSKWVHSPHSIAILIPKTELKGVFKNIIVQPNEVAVIVRDGKVEKVVESGKVKVGGLLNINSYFKDVDVVMMDTSPKDANWQVGELWTSDKHKIAAKGLIRYKIAEPKKFFLMVYAYSTTYDGNRIRPLTLDHIYERVKSEVLTRVLQPEVSDMKLDDIYGNRELQHKIENEIELQLKQTLDMWGLELLRFTSEWNLGDHN
ncbi:MAG: SPFH domain-containing protein [Candidatus Methanoperedens sp.]